MIKGSTKVGEIFLCGQETNGQLEVLQQFLGKAITGLGGGCKKMYVIEEGDSFVEIQPKKQEPFMRPNTDDDRQQGRKYQALSHQRFGMTPFDQQQNPNNMHQHNALAHVNQKIEERESLRHSTHRSQRSDRASANMMAAGALSSVHGNQMHNQGVIGASGHNQMHNTGSDRFGQTDYNISEQNNQYQERPGFSQKNNNQYHMMMGDADHMTDGNNDDGRLIMDHQNNQHQEMLDNQQHNDNEPQKIFSFDDNKNMQMGQTGDANIMRQQHQQILGKNDHGGVNRSVDQKMGHLQQICCGRDHTLNLTRDGDLFSFGTGMFSANGHGGSKEVLSPMILKPLRDKRVVKIACGESHSLILTDRADVYAWGRGFEGQLGISKSIEVASTPQYVKAFYGRPVQTIEAGAFFSLAITKDNYLFGWGEAKMGQLGLGKQREIRTPNRIPIIDNYTNQEQRIISCAAGFGHSACLTESGDLYTWGFNIYGQLGLGDMKTRWYPERVSRDISNHNMQRQIKIKCSNYATFSIDQNGHPYSWGKGSIGHKGNVVIDLPKMIETNTENRIFTDMFANDDSILFYAPLRVYSLQPSCGPSKGNTLISITGTGFVNCDKLRVRFSYGDLSQEVQCMFDEQTHNLICRTPKFEEYDGEKHPSVQLPCDCYLSVTMDGINYSECEMPFKIYSNDLQLNQINPKSGSVKGGSEVTLYLDIDEVTASCIQNLVVGFQQKIKKNNQGVYDKNQNSRQSLNESSQRGSQVNVFDEYQKQQFDFNSELNNYQCSEGYYQNGKIFCKVPQIKQGNYDPDGNLQYNVDIAINGQQFTGKPILFRYYDIRLEKIEPSFALSEGGASINIFGKGIYDSQIKRFKFKCNGGERDVTADWDKKNQCLKCIVPPLTWLWGGDEVPQQKLLEVKASPIKLMLTFNNQEWIEGPDFKYHDHSIQRIAYGHSFMAATDAAETENDWEAEIAEEVLQTEGASEEEIQKRKEEKKKKEDEETEEAKTVSKRKGYKILIYGSGFIKTKDILVKFSYQDKIQKTISCVFKNQSTLGATIPDMGQEIPVGEEHLITVDVSLDGQQFCGSTAQFLYKSVDPNLTEEDLKKMDEEDAKGAKKPGAKKGK